jgi:hypothetical protein
MSGAWRQSESKRSAPAASERATGYRFINPGDRSCDVK